MAEAYAETKHREEELWRDVKLLEAVPLRRTDPKKNLPLVQTEVDVYKSKVKDKKFPNSW